MPRFRVDLRYDTVSTPSEAMRAAMATAEVGDAWYGDDPTVNRLQDRAAELTGKEAALYVATGTMANQIGVRLQAGGQGHLVAAETSAHIATTEVMTSAVLAGIAYRTGHDHPHGYMTAALAERLLQPGGAFHGAGGAAPRAGRLLRRRGRRRARRREHGRRLRRDDLAERRHPRDPRRDESGPRRRPPRRRPDLERGRGHGRGRPRMDRAGRYDDVLSQQRARGADRLGALRARRDDPRGPTDLDPLRRCLAAGRDHGCGGLDRP